MENRYEMRREVVDGDFTCERGEFGKVFAGNNEKEPLLSCNCGAEVLKLSNFTDEDEYYLQVFKYPQSDSFAHRLKMAFNAMRGKGINTADVVLSSENFNKIRLFALALLFTASMSAQDREIYEVNENGLKEIAPKKVIVEKEDSTEIYSVNENGLRSLTPDVIIEKKDEQDSEPYAEPKD